MLNTISGTGSSPTSPHIVNVQASTNSQAYHCATRTYNWGNLYLWFEGGWENVDTAPVQTGFSLVKDTNSSPPNERGLNLEATGSAHNQTKHIVLNRFVFTNVTDAVRLYNQSNLDGSTIRLATTNVIIYAQANGIVLDYGTKNSYTVLTASNLTVVAGLGGTGSGLYLHGDFDKSLVKNSSITSAGGHGFNMQNRGSANSGGWALAQRLTVVDSIFHNCKDDGIHEDNVYGPHRGSGGAGATFYLQRVKVTDNGTDGTGTGVFLQLNAQDANPGGKLRLLATNCVVTGNAGVGIYLDARPDAKACWFEGWLVNCTVADNLNDGLFARSSFSSGVNSVTAYNTIFSGIGDDAIEVDDLTANGLTITENYNDYHAITDHYLVRVGSSGTNYPSLATNDLTVDPEYKGSGSDPYKLKATSPLGAAGTTTYAPSLTSWEKSEGHLLQGERITRPNRQRARQSL